VPKNASVFFTIFQTFMSGGEDENGEPTPYFGDYPEDFFDFIVIDECHRGGANDESSWREILDHFAPAVQLGLTATPKRSVNADTYAYFGEPVYSYALKDGINDGFLTPFKVLPIIGTMDEYIYTPGDGVVVRGEPEQGKVYTEGDFNRIITIPEREKMRVRYWMDLFSPREKTIVFCATQEHAGMVRDFINQYAVEKGWTRNSSYCVRVTANDGAAGENDLKIFQDNEKTIPTILTTSRKLSTGVDARNVRNIVLMRPCNNMIEFKQIIGRGTRMYDGKDYFTIYDFVKAHYNFSDPDWDGEPLEPLDPQICSDCGRQPCCCIRDGDSCRRCRSDPCICEKPEPEPCPDCGQRPCTCEKKLLITLSDGKTRQIKHIASALYWSPDGTPITAREFVERLFADLPRFFGDEDQLRGIWADPGTREKLLTDLAEEGYDSERLDAMKDLIDARDSDVYDVLAYIAYCAETRTRGERAQTARTGITSAYTNPRQQEFINFILDRYVQDGVAELAPSKMRGLIELKYATISDATRQIGPPSAIRETFVGFQKYLYQPEQQCG
jgi:type I restriction enzyme R subunit